MSWRARGYRRRGGLARSAAVTGVAVGLIFVGYNGTAAANLSHKSNRTLGSLTDGYNVKASGGSPIVAMVPTPDGKGYWIAGPDGSVYASGDAGLYGSLAGKVLNAPIVGMAATPDGKGYWLVASDGGIFTFGDATYLGSTGAMKLNQPIVGMAATPDGKGYWLVASDGGIFTFGDAPYAGSGVSANIGSPVAGISRNSVGGYWMVTTTGSTVDFQPGSSPVVNSAPTPVSSAPAPTGGQIAGGSSGATWDSFGVTSDASATFPNLPYHEITQAAPASAGYSFLLTQNSSSNAPVRWNPCAPINYQVNLGYAPSNGLALIQQSLAEISNATGIQFNYQGTTTQLPTLERNSVVQGPNGPEWAPVLIAWEPANATDYLPGGNVIGMGGSSAAFTGTRWTYVTGEAAFSSTYSATAGQETSLVLHELGHVMGMGHVNDPTQVMNPVDNFNAPTTYGRGDLTGLAHLGLAAGCIATPAP